MALNLGSAKEAIHRIVHHPICQDKPLILETPWLDKSTNLYREEIAYLRGNDPKAEIVTGLKS